MAKLIALDELPHEPHSHEFVAGDYGDVPFSVILVHAGPGAGPRLHRHPYAELFVVEAGEATFRIGDDEMVVAAGHVVVSPPGEAHGFRNSGSAERLASFESMSPGARVRYFFNQTRAIMPSGSARLTGAS